MSALPPDAPRKDARSSDHPIDRLFLERWSPRAFSGASMAHADLLTAFEAARWAPSSLNYQPWRFVYAHKEHPRFTDFLSLLAEKNRLWAQKASALVFFISDTRVVYGEKVMDSPSHAFDTGAAWANFAHQAFILGYSTRAIGGFDKVAAPDVLGVPAGFHVHAAVAIGVPAAAETLPEVFRAKEAPSSRRPLADMVFEGYFATSGDGVLS